MVANDEDGALEDDENAELAVDDTRDDAALVLSWSWMELGKSRRALHPCAENLSLLRILMLLLEISDGVMRGRLAMGFATTMALSTLFLRNASTDFIDNGVFVATNDGGGVKGAAGRFRGVMTPLVAAEIPKSNEGMSCGGFDKAMVCLDFLGRSRRSDVFILCWIFESLYEPTIAEGCVLHGSVI